MDRSNFQPGRYIQTRTKNHCETQTFQLGTDPLYCRQLHNVAFCSSAKPVRSWPEWEWIGWRRRWGSRRRRWTWCRGRRRREGGGRSRGGWRRASCTESRSWIPPDIFMKSEFLLRFVLDKIVWKHGILYDNGWELKTRAHLIEGNAAPSRLRQEFSLPLEVIHLKCNFVKLPPTSQSSRWGRKKNYNFGKFNFATNDHWWCPQD